MVFPTEVLPTRRGWAGGAARCPPESALPRGRGERRRSDARFPAPRCARAAPLTCAGPRPPQKPFTEEDTQDHSLALESWGPRAFLRSLAHCCLGNSAPGPRADVSEQKTRHCHQHTRTRCRKVHGEGCATRTRQRRSKQKQSGPAMGNQGPGLRPSSCPGQGPPFWFFSPHPLPKGCLMAAARTRSSTQRYPGRSGKRPCCSCPGSRCWITSR